MQPQTEGIPHLVVLGPSPDRGRRVELRRGYMVVGRGEMCDVRFNDPHVSRTHAALRLEGGAVYVQDLGSSAGTFVNGTPAAAARELRVGDVVSLATVQLRFEMGPAVAGGAHDPPRGRTADTPVAASVHFDVDRQHAHAIHNVGRDQYHSYVQHVNQQRDSFLRDIASTKTKARWLIWTGFLAFVAGFGLFAAAILGFLQQGADAVATGVVEPPTDPFGAEVMGVPSGLLGWALAAVGVLLLIVGIVLHVVAASRRRRVDREFPLPSPWQVPNQWGG